MRSHCTKYLVTILCFLGVFRLHSEQHPSNCAVTYEFSGGRLGDNIISYMHAKWISYKYQIPLLYKPFPYSNELVLDDMETRVTRHRSAKYRRIVYLGKDQTVDLNVKVSTLYVVPYFPESECERRCFTGPGSLPWPYFEVNWNDPGFKACICEMIKPKTKLQLCPVQKDKLNVALHIRLGGDCQHDKGIGSGTPQKSPPETFYFEQLETICRIFRSEKIHVHLFTDDSNPSRLAHHCREYLNEERVEFTYRESGNVFDKNVLEDLFSLMQFDCLIRPESNFSIVASLLTDYKVLIYPDDFTFMGKTPYINKVKIKGSHEGLSNENSYNCAWQR